MWNEVSKEHDCDDAFNSSGHKILCFEPIVLRFNTNDCLNTFWYFLNKHTKRHEHRGKGLTLDVNHSLQNE